MGSCPLLHCLMTYLLERYLSKGLHHISDFLWKAPQIRATKGEWCHNSWEIEGRCLLQEESRKWVEVSLQPKEPFWKDVQSPWAGGAWRMLRDHPPSCPSCHQEAALCFWPPAIWVAKSNSSWSSFSPHLLFFFTVFFFPFLFPFDIQRNDQSSGSFEKWN